MSMADGAPLEQGIPATVNYLVWARNESFEDGPRTLARTFSNQRAANDFVGSDTRYEIEPVLVFGSAKDAKAYSPTRMRDIALSKLTEVERLALKLL